MKKIFDIITVQIFVYTNKIFKGQQHFSPLNLVDNHTLLPSSLNTYSLTPMKISQS